MKAIINVKIYDYQTYIENGYCIYGKEIIEVGEMKNFPDFDEEIIDGKNKILLPGFINSHTHIYSTLVRGASIPFNPKSFRDILEQLWWKFDSKLDNTTTFHSAMVYGLESLKNGVTSLIDHHASGIEIIGSLEALKKAIVDKLGMRGIFCFETSDRFNITECIEENLASLKYDYSDARGMFGLHASMSLSEETLDKVSRVLKGAPIHVHVAESIEDEDDSLEKYNIRVVDRYLKYGLLNKDSILAHCVHIDEEEAKKISDKKAVIALNPTSNMNNAVGSFNIDIFRDNDIQILIGNDGLGTNIAKEWTYFFFAGKAGINDAAGIGFDELLKYINGSYEYFGRQMGIKIGKIKEGYVADFVLVPYLNPTDMDENNAFSHVFFGLFDNFNPSCVIVKGKTLIENYESIFDEETLYKNAHIASKALWERLGDA
ncbi:MAG: amidohydrolase family protein [Candidatus Heimdallarchaeota archaeon]|nr:amidohydrolase family protein [Candidatus Heimdallarchaeota archaeon]MCK4954064.1 amidohydrolase family protein [Candidatus Heimdallarchaeota archaeon]